MKSSNHVIFNKALGASFNSDPIQLLGAANFAVQISVTGSSALNGTFKLQGTCDVVEVDPDGTPSKWVGLNTWSDLGVSQAFTADGNVLWDVVNCGYTYARIVYTSTAGTATNTTARVNAKTDA